MIGSRCACTMGRDILVVRAGQTVLSGGRERQVTVVKTLVPADAEAIGKECPSVALAAPATLATMSVDREGLVATTAVVGLTADGLRIRDLEVASGRPFEAEECRSARRVALIGRTVARTLFGDADPVGDALRIRNASFEVVGVLAPKGADAAGTDQDDLVVVPLETAMRRLLNAVHVQAICVQAARAEVMHQAEREVRELLRDRHRLGAKDDDFTIQNQAVLLRVERETRRALTALTVAAAGISLAVGGAGVLAVMLMAVRERMGEIGLRRAVGARRRDIAVQFLLESSLLAGSGGFLGVLLGIGASVVLSRWGGWHAIVSWPAAATAFSFSVMVGLGSGLYPAIRAARLEPIRALRGGA